MKTLLLGAHLSVAGGHYRAIEEGLALGCTAIQVFTKNQVRWSAKPLTASDVDIFREASRRALPPAGGLAPPGIRLVCGHGSYLYNFASPSRPLIDRSIAGLLDELRRCDQLGIPFLVVHPGSHMGAGEQTGLRAVTESLASVLERYGGRAAVCLESTAGQGTGLGYRFEQLGSVIRDLADPRIGACVDSCHIFAAGYDIRTRGGYRATIGSFMREVGLGRLKVIHLNDSLGGVGSRVDRHAHIGRGAIGKDAFRFFMRDRRLRGVAKIIETPKKLDGRDMDRVNLALLRKLAGPDGVGRRK